MLVHTILDVRFGIYAGRVMKLLTYTFFTLLLTGSAGSSYGQDFEESKLLAEQGDPSAQNNLGVMYDNRRDVSENYTGTASSLIPFHSEAMSVLFPLAARLA